MDSSVQIVKKGNNGKKWGSQNECSKVNKRKERRKWDKKKNTRYVMQKIKCENDLILKMEENFIENETRKTYCQGDNEVYKQAQGFN